LFLGILLLLLLLVIGCGHLHSLGIFPTVPKEQLRVWEDGTDGVEVDVIVKLKWNLEEIIHTFGFRILICCQNPSLTQSKVS
jgi:hypothetical protein